MATPEKIHILQSLLFYPRGGSAHVANYLGRELERAGIDTTIVAGSLGDTGSFSHAPSFYKGRRLFEVDYNAAAKRHQLGGDPMEADFPFHPSYEDRGPSVPDRLFTATNAAQRDWSSKCWISHFERVKKLAPTPNLLHLHHLTVQHDAARLVFPNTPSIAHLHGTELKMIELSRKIRDGERPSDFRSESWEQGLLWEQYLSGVARQADHIVTTSPADINEAVDLLGVSRSKIISIPNGVDTSLFCPRPSLPEDTRQRLTHLLVEDPKGWDTTGRVGSISYQLSDIEPLFRPNGEAVPLIMYNGRFTAVKRISLLIESFVHSIELTGSDAALLIWGGFPGEWEGEHPFETVNRLKARNVFFVGWHSHDQLSAFLPSIDILVLPSVNESFGQVLLEAMACGKPVIAVNRGGPPSFIRATGADANGWLVEPDDLTDLVGALRGAIENPEELYRRGANALRTVTANYSWDQVAKKFTDLYSEVCS